MTTQHTSVQFANNNYSRKVQDNAGSTGFDHKAEHGILTFRKEVERSIRGAKTIYRDTNSAWVYMEGEYMTMGWIGYGDFQSSKSGPSKYVVYSRSIRNCKYNDGNNQFHMRMAKHMDIALKAAKSELRNYTSAEIATALKKKVREPVMELRGDARQAYQNALKKVGLEYYGTATDRMQYALAGLMSAGHVFPDLELNADIKTLLSAAKENNRLQTDKLPMRFVRIYEKFGKQRVDVARVDDVLTSYLNVNSEHVATWDAADVPEELQGQVAVMSMCEAGQFVEGVGYKVDDTTFYFYEEDVTT